MGLVFLRIKRLLAQSFFVGNKNEKTFTMLLQKTKKRRGNMKKLVSLILALAISTSLVACSGSNNAEEENKKKNYENATKIELSNDYIFVEGDNKDAVFESYDVIYYEDKEAYESGNVYGEGSDGERHTAEEAAKVKVVNITKPGAYRLSGKMDQGQIRVDLGEEAKANPEAIVTLVLDNADITCDIAPAILFLNVYECDAEWSKETASMNVDTSKAGANLIIADGSINNIKGSHVAKIFCDDEKPEKLWKQDGAIYSYMSTNIDSCEIGDGVLNIEADKEGISGELHLTINGGNINIRSGDDGINASEDYVSVITINDGNINIVAGIESEGDGIDSNGWLIINGGTVVGVANPSVDGGMDSDMGSYINGGTVVALGSNMDWAESNSKQVAINLQFKEENQPNQAIVVKDLEGNIIFAYSPSESDYFTNYRHYFKGAVISCPDFKVGEDYEIYIGGTLTGNDVSGICDVKTITDYTDGVQQGWTGTDINIKPVNAEPELHKTHREKVMEDRLNMTAEERHKARQAALLANAGDDLENKVKVNKNFFGKNQKPVATETQDNAKTSEENTSKDVSVNGVFQPVPTFHMQNKVNNFSGVRPFYREIN